jgi:hypothetical protein
MMDLCGPLLNGRHLVLDLSHLLLEGVLISRVLAMIQGRNLNNKKSGSTWI